MKLDIKWVMLPLHSRPDHPHRQAHQVHVMARAEGYAMVRRPRGRPFVVEENCLTDEQPKRPVICPECATSAEWATGQKCPVCGEGGPQ